MTFKIIVQQMPVGVEFEVGSLSEAAAILEQEDSQIRKIGAIAKSLNDDGAEPAPAAEAEQPTKRTRGPNKPKPPVEAVAPDPIPVPPVAAVAPPPVVVLPSPPTAPVAPVTPDIPSFLRNQDAPVAPPPPLPAAAPPPVGVLGPKVVKALDALKEGKPDGGQALADWLAAAGLTIKGKTYDEATRAVLMISDEKITAAGVLEPLGIS